MHHTARVSTAKQWSLASGCRVTFTPNFSNAPCTAVPMSIFRRPPHCYIQFVICISLHVDGTSSTLHGGRYPAYRGVLYCTEEVRDRGKRGIGEGIGVGTLLMCLFEFRGTYGSSRICCKSSQRRRFNQVQLTDTMVHQTFGTLLFAQPEGKL